MTSSNNYNYSNSNSNTATNTYSTTSNASGATTGKSVPIVGSSINSSNSNSSSNDIDIASIYNNTNSTHVSENVARYIVEAILSPMIRNKYRVALHKAQQQEEQQPPHPPPHAVSNTTQTSKIYHHQYMELLLRTVRCTFEELQLISSNSSSSSSNTQSKQQHHQQQHVEKDRLVSTTTTTTAASQSISKTTISHTDIPMPVQHAVEEYIIQRLSNQELHKYGGLSILHAPILMTIIRFLHTHYMRYPNAQPHLVKYLQRTSTYTTGKRNNIHIIQHCFHSVTSTSTSTSTSTTIGSKVLPNEHFLNYLKSKTTHSNSSSNSGSKILVANEKCIQHVKPKQLYPTGNTDFVVPASIRSMSSSINKAAAIRASTSSSVTNYHPNLHYTTAIPLTTSTTSNKFLASSAPAFATTKTMTNASSAIKYIPTSHTTHSPSYNDNTFGVDGGFIIDDDNDDNIYDDDGNYNKRTKTTYEQELVTKILHKVNSSTTTPQQQNIPYHLLTTSAANYYNYMSNNNHTNRVNEEEILSSYRKLVRKLQDSINQSKLVQNTSDVGSTIPEWDNVPYVSEEEVIRDIIIQREEREDAKQMDYARLLSEQTRKEESKRRRDQIQQEFIQSIEQCTNIEYLLDPNDKRLFSTSWILQDKSIQNFAQQQFQATIDGKPLATDSTSEKEASSSTVIKPPSSFRTLLVSLLQLEKNALKWYGAMLPKSYFTYRVIERINSAIILDVEEGESSTTNSSTTAIDPTHYSRKQIQLEINELNDIMYNLSSQVGGVPKAFRDIHDQYKLKVKSTIVEPPPPQLSTSSSSTSLSTTASFPIKKQKVAMDNEGNASSSDENNMQPATKGPQADALLMFIDLCESDDETDNTSINLNTQQKDHTRLFIPPGSDVPTIEKVVPAAAATTTAATMTQSPKQHQRFFGGAALVSSIRNRNISTTEIITNSSTVIDLSS